MRRLSFVAMIFLVAFPAYPQLGSVLKGLGGGKGPDDSKVASGLKQALEVGTANTVVQTGAPDGFFSNSAIKILMPEKLRTLDKGLRMAGQGAQIDDFELAMNRAAEKAAPAAKDIFRTAITEMSFEDARGILSGGNTAATHYFKDKTSARLTDSFRPIVESSMGETGVMHKYKALSGPLSSLPFGRSQSFDITSYVVSKSLDGLFYVLGQEEQKIRTNPAAQVTPLLKQVFGGRL